MVVSGSLMSAMMEVYVYVCCVMDGRNEAVVSSSKRPTMSQADVGKDPVVSMCAASQELGMLSELLETRQKIGGRAAALAALYAGQREGRSAVPSGKLQLSEHFPRLANQITKWLAISTIPSSML